MHEAVTPASATETSPTAPPVAVEVAKTPEVAAAPTVKEVPKTDAAAPVQKDSQRFALLNRQTKELATQRARLKASAQAERSKLEQERQAWQTEQAQAAKELEEYRALKAKALIEPEAFQKHFYGDDWYVKLSEYVAGDKKPHPALVAKDIDEKVAKKLVEVEKRNDARWRAEEQRRIRESRAQETQVEQEFSAGVAKWVTERADKYDLINRQNAQWRVADLIKRNHQQNRTLVEVEDAAEAVEKFLELEARKYLESPKLKPKEATKQEHNALSQQQVHTEPPRSLNNDLLAGGPPVSPYISNGGDKDVARAIAAFEKIRSSQR